MFEHSLPSIERFAAYLDGNLSQSEMQQFSQLAERDSVLHQLLEASTEVNNTFANFTESDLQLPPEIIDLDFELPAIPSEGISPLVTLAPEPIDNMLVAAVENVDEDISIYSDVNQKVNSSVGDEIHNDSSYLMPENDDFDNGGDLDGGFSECQ